MSKGIDWAIWPHGYNPPYSLRARKRPCRGLAPAEAELRGVGLLAAEREAADRELRVARGEPLGESQRVGAVHVLVLLGVDQRDGEALLQARVVGDHHDELAARRE